MTAKYYVPDLQKYEWQKSVIDKDILTPPGGPAAGDRYLINGVGLGGWAGQDGNITTWDGAAWVYAIKREGMLVWAKDEDKYYGYNGATWVLVDLHSHSNLTLLETYDQTNADLTAAVSGSHAKSHAITSTLDHTSAATSGKMLKADANGLPVDATNTDTEVASAVSRIASYNAGLECLEFTI